MKYRYSDTHRHAAMFEEALDSALEQVTEESSDLLRVALQQEWPNCEKRKYNWTWSESVISM